LLRGGHRQAVEERFKRLRKQIEQDLEDNSGKEIPSEEFKNTAEQIDIYGNSCSLLYSYIYIISFIISYYLGSSSKLCNLYIYIYV
jgi:hypothetical protein